MGEVMKILTAFAAAMAGVLAFAGAASAAPIPSGSYQQSCDDIYADWNVLTATCRTQNGGENYTTLSDYRNCSGDIANVYGRLQCVGDQNGDDDDDQWIPRGSYRETCRREDVEGRTLKAECQDRNGRWRYTELANFRSCQGDIYNANGMLGCRRGGDDGDDDDDDDDGLPGGNWRYSCRDYRVYGRVLYAECRDNYGTWRATSIDLRQCGNNVSNFGGRLVCGPGGGYGRITLYKDTNFGGRSRTYTTSIPDLNHYAFGNQASSVLIQGGLWQLCDRPNYRGHCIVVSRSRSNLWSVGFNNRTESVRRLR